MSDWLNRKDLCQRCFFGIDDDHDGNCPSCASWDDRKAAWMKKARLDMEIIERQEKLNAKGNETSTSLNPFDLVEG